MKLVFVNFSRGNKLWSLKMFLAVMLVCLPLNLIHYDKECFGVEDTTGYHLSKPKCHKRTNEMENQILASLSYPVMVRKNCIKIKLKAA